MNSVDPNPAYSGQTGGLMGEHWLN
jgi:hypothetical protein